MEVGGSRKVSHWCWDKDGCPGGGGCYWPWGATAMVPAGGGPLGGNSVILPSPFTSECVEQAT